MEDPFFQSTVLLLCSYDQEGAFGIILNRPLEIDVNIILKQVPITFPKIPPKPALFGGPVGMTSCMILFEGDRSVDDVGFSILDQDTLTKELEKYFREKMFLSKKNEEIFMIEN